MEYRLARDIRGRSLSSLITSNITEGKGVTSAIKGALSQKLKARGTAIKEKFDPLNVVRFMTGGSRLATAVAGRLTGRKRSDIEYFTRTPRSKRTYSPMSRGTPGELDSSSIGILSDILNFMKQTHEEDRERQQTEKSFQEEKENEEQRRHDRFLAVLQQYVSVTSGIGPTPKQEPETESLISKLLSSIKSAIAGVIDAMKAIISSVFKGIVTLLSKLMGGIVALIGTLLTGMKKIITSLIGKLLSGLKWLGSLKKFFKGPFFKFITSRLFLFLLGIAGPAALAYALLKYVADIAPDMKALSPEEALNLLRSGSANELRNTPGGIERLRGIVSKQTETKEKAKYLLDKVKNGRVTDEDAKEIRRMGGVSILEKILQEKDIDASELANVMKRNALEEMPALFGQTKEDYLKAKPGKEAWWEKSVAPFYDEMGVRRDLSGTFEPPANYKKMKSGYQAGGELPKSLGEYDPNIPTPPSAIVTPIPPRQIEQTPLIDYNEGSLMMTLPDTNIVNRSSNPVSLPDKPQPVSASVRNKEPMIRHVITGRVIVTP